MFVAEEAELYTWVARLLADRVHRGEITIDGTMITKVMVFLERVSRDETEAREAQRAAEYETDRQRRVLDRVFRAILDVGGEAFTHEVVDRLRQEREDDDPLDLTTGGWARRWHREWINSPRCVQDGQAPARRRPAA